MSEFYIGLMSGTSVDGIDASLVDFSAQLPKLIAFKYQPFTTELRKKIAQISTHQALLLKDYGALDCQLGHLLAQAVNQLLAQANIPHSAISAIGSHGQTVFHAPNDPWPFSLQIGDPNIIAELTQITTVADFRRRDIAAKGQGAPLAPAFHQVLFKSAKKNIGVINIGGIANLSVLFGQQLIAFDTGTGNTLMDYWCQQHLNKPYDHQGEWAKSGQVIGSLLNAFKQTDYFKLSPPKSTGKEYFSVNWLQQHLLAYKHCQPQDIQATLSQLTADSISNAIQQFAKDIDELLVCGGGAHNHHLMRLLDQQPYSVKSTATQGIDPDHVEAMAFAWLAQQTIHRRAGNLTDVTGANTAVMLGGIYPAGY
jgi:anhydro-N-acetylmuramic acid kinase